MSIQRPSNSAVAPVVSIGLPVYNGESYLAAAIDSILKQNYTAFELLLVDNGSTDGTETICRQYVATDARVRYARAAKNLGAAANFNRAFSLARGDYFKWAAHDDLLAPTYLERCVEALLADPEVVLCAPLTTLIDVNGTPLHDYAHTLWGGSQEHPQQRFAHLLLTRHWAVEVFGLIRRSVLSQTHLIQPFVASDKVLLAELALRGRFHIVPETLFYSREHDQRSVRALPIHRRSHWFDTTVDRRLIMPHWQLLRGYEAALQRTTLSGRERLLCYGHLARWAFTTRTLWWLLADPMLAVAPSLGDRVWRWKQRRWSRNQRAAAAGQMSITTPTHSHTPAPGPAPSDPTHT